MTEAHAPSGQVFKSEQQYKQAATYAWVVVTPEGAPWADSDGLVWFGPDPEEGLAQVQSSILPQSFDEMLNAGWRVVWSMVFVSPVVYTTEIAKPVMVEAVSEWRPE